MWPNLRVIDGGLSPMLRKRAAPAVSVAASSASKSGAAVLPLCGPDRLAG